MVAPPTAPARAGDDNDLVCKSRSCMRLVSISRSSVPFPDRVMRNNVPFVKRRTPFDRTGTHAVKTGARAEKPKAQSPAARHARVDAQRHLGALVEAAKAVFVASGVDAAVFRREVDACAAAAPALAREHEPDEALARWLRQYTRFIATKRGLAAALHSGDRAFDALPAYFRKHLEPALQALLDAAVSAGRVRNDVEPYELLRAVGNLCLASGKNGDSNGQRMVDLLIDGLRYSAPAAAPALSSKRPRRRK